MSSKGRIELQMGVSGAEIREKPAGDVRFCVVPQKPIKNCEKLIFQPIFPKFSECVRVLPNASRRIQTHPNASEQVQAGPSNSKNFKKLAKTCENIENFAKQFEQKCAKPHLLWERSKAILLSSNERAPTEESLEKNNKKEKDTKEKNRGMDRAVL